MQSCQFSGKFRIQHLRCGEVLNEFDVPNGIVNVGLNHILETQFRGGSQITTWYIGLINNAGFSSLSNSDTMASHAGWAETTAYSNSTRPAWGPGEASNRQITNATPVDFNMNGTVTVKGLFICGGAGANTKGGTSGTLWSTATFGSTIALNSGDVLKVTYTLSG